MIFQERSITLFTDDELELIFSINEERLPAVFEGSVVNCKYYFLNLFLSNSWIDQIPTVDKIRRCLLKALRQQDNYRFSWLFSQGIEQSFYILELLQQLTQAKLISSEEYIDLILNDEPLIPFDFRAHLMLQYIRNIATGCLKFTHQCGHKIIEFIHIFSPRERRKQARKWAFLSDGNDHLFCFPKNSCEISQLLLDAAHYKAQEGIFYDLEVLIDTLKMHCPELKLMISPMIGLEYQNKKLLLLQQVDDAWFSSKANELINLDLSCKLREWHHYIVAWEQEIAKLNRKNQNLTYTIYELLQILQHSNVFHTPDLHFNKVLLSFYRGVLKISAGANVGIRGGAYCVEHNSEDTPSVYYQGRNAVIGEACLLETVGGIALLNGSYLGGTFIPAVIRTHKHQIQTTYIQKDDSYEKVMTRPGFFLAVANTRLAFSTTTLFDVVDCIDKESPYPGIMCLPVQTKY